MNTLINLDASNGKKYLSLLESSRDLIQSVNNEDQFEFVNQAWKKTLGYTEEELSCITLMDIIAPRFHTHCDQMKHAVLGGQSFDNFELTLIAKSGKEIQVLGSSSPYTTEGIIRGTFSFFRNITELKEAEGTYQDLFEHSQDLLFVLDSHNRMLNVNPAVVDYYGYDRKELLGVSMLEKLTYPGLNDLAEIESLIQACWYKKQNQRFDWIGQTLAGKIVHTELIVTRGRYFGEEVVIAYGRDLTERRKQAQALQQSEALQRAVLHALPDFTFQVDRAGNILNYFSKRTEWDIPQDFSIGKVITDVIPVQMEEVAIKSIHWALDMGSVAAFEFEIEYKGNTKSFEARINAINQEEAILAIRDISAQKETQLALAEKLNELDGKNKQLQRYITSNWELEKFAYMAAHDLREPLTTVIGFAEMLNKRHRDQINAEGQGFLDFILKASHQMNKLVTGLLNYSRVNSEELSIEPIEVLPLIDQILQSLDSRIQETQASIVVDTLPEIIYGSPLKIKQLFQNLIANALKFHLKEKAPKILIQSEENDKHWLFSVTDNGIGIAPEDQEKIFPMFQRLHAKSAFEGSGIGLALCRRIVEQHQGEIWVESALGEGSAFFFTLSKALYSSEAT